MVTSFKMYYGGTYVDVPVEYILYADLVDNGDAAVNELQASFNRSVLGTTYDPVFSKEIKMLVGSAEIFGGQIERPEREDVLLNISAYSFGAEFLYRYVNEVFENVTPEYIVEYVITNYTSLTYASSVTTGITIERIVFRDKTVAEVLQLIAKTLDYAFYTDVNKNAYFEPNGAISTGITLTVGDSTATNKVVNKPVWNYNTDFVITKVIVEGDKQTFEKNESFTASAAQTTFTLVYEPEDVEVQVDSVVQAPTVSGSTTGVYSVKKESKEIVFSSGLTGGETVAIKYSYAVPIKVTAISDQADAQGNTLIRERKIINKSIKNFQEARNFAQKYLDAHAEAQKSTEIEILGYNADLIVGRTVTVVDSTESINETFLITGSSYSYPDEIMTLQVGPLPELLFDWQKEVMERLREISQVDSNSDLLQDYKQFKSNLKVNLGSTGQLYDRSMEDTLIANHTTLGYARADLNQEVDCSGNGNDGVWQGTGIDGSQYTTSGHRLSAGVFNGTDNSIDMSGAPLTSSDKITVFFAHYPTANGTGSSGRIVSRPFGSNSGGRNGSVGFNSDNKYTFHINNGVTSDTLVSTDAFALNTWHYIFARWDPATGNAELYVDSATTPQDTGSLTGTPLASTADFTVGRDTSASQSFATGKIDEVKVFNTYEDTSVFTDCINKNFYSNHASYANCKLWWSMDNPRAGDRRGSFVQVELF